MCCAARTDVESIGFVCLVDVFTDLGHMLTVSNFEVIARTDLNRRGHISVLVLEQAALASEDGGTVQKNLDLEKTNRGGDGSGGRRTDLKPTSVMVRRCCALERRVATCDRGGCNDGDGGGGRRTDLATSIVNSKHRKQRRTSEVDDAATWCVEVDAGDGVVVRDERWNQWTGTMVVNSFNGGLMATEVLAFAI
ncbi:hypothetical protein U1Q18_007871 [Sarracenia purpurea var. burkii]